MLYNQIIFSHMSNFVSSCGILSFQFKSINEKDIKILNFSEQIVQEN